jgi:hypothetical protein
MVLLLVLVTTTGIIGFLGVTESSLPPRARIMFAVIGTIGVLASLFALRALSNRPAMLAWQRVIAARMGVACAATVVIGASIIGWLKAIPAAFAIVGFGVFLLGGTIALLRQENRKFAALTARRNTLAQQLNPRG